MRLRFKTQQYQTDAVNAVADVFKGQPFTEALNYRIDPGDRRELVELAGFRNAEILLSDAAVLANLKAVQIGGALPVSPKLNDDPPARLNLDVEMETGTGKTYVYIKTLFELNKRYGWSKFIIVVPSIAIREGVAKSLEITAEHFLETYKKKARFFIYDSAQLHQLDGFSSDAGISVMIINVQAFNARGADARRIYEELDEFQSRKPIEVIAANRPILILDEPQKMEGKATLDSLANFKPLFILRYSATHRTQHDKVYRLDAVDAYNQRLVKKIAVRGIAVKPVAGTGGYLYLQSIEVSSNKPPMARLEFEVRQGKGLKRVLRKLKSGDNLFELSGDLQQYKKGYVITDINANTDTVSFTNGVVLRAGEVVGKVEEEELRHIQIREAIKAHFDREQGLFLQGIKALSLFFIDEVVKYRDYSATDEKGGYARLFEEIYAELRDEALGLADPEYKKYLERATPAQVHAGYFSIDKKSKKQVDGEVEKRGENKGLSNDSDAYDLILKDKERLLSFEEPVRFIFSHSALREGWDNPNVFVICALKQSDNVVSRRQEVGRGLRLCVNQSGERMDNPVNVHDINVLTVVSGESYSDFVKALQKEIASELGERLPVVDAAFFKKEGLAESDAKLIESYLLINGYVENGAFTAEYHSAVEAGALASLPAKLSLPLERTFELISKAATQGQLPEITDDRRPKKNPLNQVNFAKKEFQELWSRINKKAVYAVDFDSRELVSKSVAALDRELHVEALRFTVVHGTQSDQQTADSLATGTGFVQTLREESKDNYRVHSEVRYDLLGKLVELTKLTRRTLADVLKGVAAPTFAKFAVNPESFITEVARIINEQKATMIVEHLSYDPIDGRYDTDIFTTDQTRQDFSKAGQKLKKHIYEYALTDSKIERTFVEQLDSSDEVVVYAKLPKGFLIPTPVGDYNPDWAISFKDKSVKHIYFVAETKGDMSSLVLSGIEKAKVDCAHEFFKRLSSANVRYGVVRTFDNLLTLVRE